MNETLSSLMVEYAALTIFHQRNPDVLETEIVETQEVIKRKMKELMK